MSNTETAVAAGARLAPLRFRRVDSDRDLLVVVQDAGDHRPGRFIAIARDQESKVRGTGRDFLPLLNPSFWRERPKAIDPNDRQIGEFDGMMVWVKPWVPPGHVACCTEDEALAAHGVYRADTLTVT